MAGPLQGGAMVAGNINSLVNGGADLITGEADALGIDFTFATLSQQMRVTTSSVAVDSDPATKFTYTSPSVKITRRASGLWTATNGTTELPYEWSAAGVPSGLLNEEARTNLCLRGSDLTNASWTKSNLTTAATSTGPDGVANSATRCTASAGNATALQAITSAAAARITSMLVKRITGSGNIDITQDNGGTWTTVTTTTSWTRVELPVATTTDPTVGLRIVTNADAVDVALFQHEVGSFTTSPIATAGVAVTRAKDQLTLATSAYPHSDSVGTIVINATTKAARNYDLLYVVGDGTNNERHNMQAGAFDVVDLVNAVSGNIVDGGAVQTTFDSRTAPATGHTPGTPFKMGEAYAVNDVAYVLNGGTVQTDAAATMPTCTTLFLGQYYDTTFTFTGYIRQFTYLKRRCTNGELQTRTT